MRSDTKEYSKSNEAPSSEFESERDEVNGRDASSLEYEREVFDGDRVSSVCSVRAETKEHSNENESSTSEFGLEREKANGYGASGPDCVGHTARS